MAKIEVDEEEYARQKRVYDTLAKIVADPKRKAKLEALHKEVDPNVPTPTLEAEKALNEPVEAIRKEFADFKKSQEDDRAKRTEEDQRAALTTRFETGRGKLRAANWTDDGIKAVEDLMEKQGILDHEIAAAYIEKQNPPQPPAMPGGTGSWNFLDIPAEDKDADIKRLITQTALKESSDSVTDKMARDALNEFRSATARR